jgi:Tfp pilus assembly protein PilO
MKLQSEKRNQLVAIAIGTVLVLGAIWFFFISPRYAALHHARKAMADKEQQLQKMDDTVKKAGDTATELHDVSVSLSQMESDVASGDPNAWVYDLLRHFKENYKVDISISGQASISDVDLFPKFPYKQLRASVNGTAYYHDLGDFIANFENTYPHIRLVGLNISPSSGTDEKLSFRMDIVALMKSTGP